MDNTTQPNGAIPPVMTPPPVQQAQTHEHKPIGPIIGALIIVLILIVGALYIWGQKLNLDERKKMPGSEQITGTTTAEEAAYLQTNLEANMSDIDNLNF